MTDLSKEIMEKANGGLKLNPDEQRRFLGTFEERVLGYADLKTSNSPQLQKGFLKVLKSLNEQANPLFVKISPNIEFDKQVFYLKEAKEVVDGAPKVLKEAASKAEAEEIKTKLEGEGAKVTLK